MKLKNLLKFRKEIFFLKCVFTKPLIVFRDTVWDFITNPDLWLVTEIVVLLSLLFRIAFNDVLSLVDISITIDEKIVYISIIIFLTFVYKLYRSQSFQDEYKKQEMERIKKGLEEL